MTTSKPPHTAIVTCMDPRVRLPGVLGDAAAASFVLRNGGGRVTDDVLRSLVLCTRLLGVTDVGVVHHTDCRLQAVSNEELILKTGVDIDFMPISDPLASVLEDVGRLRSGGALSPQVTVWGGLYSVEDHTMRVIAGTP
ncbi:MAG TPA: carbonic anhydrase [Streptosporangiaceae bacterium]|jgi:carbonic anhydrase